MNKEPSLTRWIGGTLMSGLALIGLSACSTVEPPAEKVSQAEFAVREASERRAPQYASLELRRARDKLAEARQAMSRENYVTARRLAEQALVDAQLAQEKAEAEIARQNAEEFQKNIETLRAEIGQQSER